MGHVYFIVPIVYHYCGSRNKGQEKARLNHRITRPKSTAPTQFLVLGELFLAADNPASAFLNQGILTKDD